MAARGLLRSPAERRRRRHARNGNKRKTVMLVEPRIDGSQWGAKRGLDPRRSRPRKALLRRGFSRERHARRPHQLVKCRVIDSEFGAAHRERRVKLGDPGDVLYATASRELYGPELRAV